jgi:hypothetical protein
VNSSSGVSWLLSPVLPSDLGMNSVTAPGVASLPMETDGRATGSPPADSRLSTTSGSLGAAKSSVDSSVAGVSCKAVSQASGISPVSSSSGCDQSSTGHSSPPSTGAATVSKHVSNITNLATCPACLQNVHHAWLCYFIQKAVHCLRHPLLLLCCHQSSHSPEPTTWNRPVRG